MNELFSVANAGIRYGALWALRGVTARLDAGEFVAIAGPNGAGKSTLLHLMSGLRTPDEGSCTFERRSVQGWVRRDFARAVSVVPQSVRVDFSFTAEQVVLMGRTPHADAMFESVNDLEVVRRAMELTDTAALAARDFRTLSGGERQRVVLASALAQEPRALLLDEPSTWLDIEHQILLYRLLRRLTERGTLVVTITHDLNLAAMYCSRVLLLEAGKLAGDGTPGDVLHPAMLRSVFRVQAHVQPGPQGRPQILYEP